MSDINLTQSEISSIIKEVLAKTNDLKKTTLRRRRLPTCGINTWETVQLFV
jgi:hypothetical protein